MVKTDASRQFAALWSQLDGRTLWVPEYRFAPPRRWRFDFACPEKLVAVEVEGITYFGRGIGRHQSHKGYMADCEKYNLAIELGWRVLRYTQLDLRQRPVQVIEQVQQVLAKQYERRVDEALSEDKKQPKLFEE